MASLHQTPFSDNPVRAVLLLGCRILLGLVLIAHGWQKLTIIGIDGVAAQMARSGVPVPTLAAIVAATIEFVGGICILLGLFTWVAGSLVALLMAGAYAFVHRGNGVLVDNGGWELVAAIGVAALLLALTSPGDLSLDQALSAPHGRPRRRGRRS
ncbi:DoxX family membrane protein [Arsenicicoccus sp. MKL-02]|uniref:DoxX family membrane protein n=1 Tax=Arsenicicoccus cauae TaxID=2663847 RepID=A0A6I3IQL2_9MICO|nr:DoxX family protein [Arsenicicoccus cauae]MTB70979.1 DoxX family membrane protein [Arsenicicoccus cauae]